MITARELDDTGSSRIGRFLPLFQSAPEPDIDADDWSAWETLLRTRLHDSEEDPRETMCIVTDRGYGTVSSSMIALPSAEHPDRNRVWKFANGRPDKHAFERVTSIEVTQ